MSVSERMTKLIEAYAWNVARGPIDGGRGFRAAKEALENEIELLEDVASACRRFDNSKRDHLLNALKALDSHREGR